MEKIIGRTFKEVRVNLDFNEYEKCNFVRCLIHTDHGDFALKNCDFSDCKLSLGRPARTIAKLISLFYPDMPFWIEGEETKEEILLRMKERLRKEGVI